MVYAACVLMISTVWAAGTGPSTEVAGDPNEAVVAVVDKQGTPLADVYVVDCETQEQYTTDAKGQFACRRSDQTQYFYAVDRRRSLALIAPLEGGARQLRMELKPAQIISGRVTDPNGRPAAGVRVASEPITSSCVLTDEQGHFDVGVLPSTWAPRGLCLTVRHIERDLAAMLDISGRAARVDIQLAPALSLSGTVTTVEGTPIPGASISVLLRRWNWGHFMPVKRAVTDAGGRFTIRALPQLQEYELHIRADRYVVEELTTGVISVVKDREEIGPVVLAQTAPPETTTEMGRLRLRLVDEDLKPVDATSAQMWKKQPWGGSEAQAVLLVSSRTPGLYEINQLPTGKYDALSIDVEGFAPFRLPDVEVRQEPQEVITCKLARGGTIAGVVTDEQGKPLADLPVVVNSALCRRALTTDPNGRFSSSHLPDAHYSVVVEPEAESPYATTVLGGGASADAGDLRIVAKPKTEVKVPTSLVGTSVWQLSPEALPLERSRVAGKAILLCLFDPNQRPSRNCLRQLGSRAKELEGKGVIVAALQVTSTDHDRLDTWARENNIGFPVGILPRGTRGAPGLSRIESLPWLILTDAEHVVRAEGFNIGDIEQVCGKLQ